jgi:hypothetical protein
VALCAMWRAVVGAVRRWFVGRRRAEGAFEGAKLTVELVPSTSWGANLRSELSREGWDRLRRACYRRAEFRCEICGGRGAAHPVECHERWEYDEGRGIQRLVGLIALCPGCHAVKHLGRTMAEGGYDAAVEHLMRVNGWGREVTHRYVDYVFALWERRSGMAWRLDIDWVGKNGGEGPS